MGTSKKRSRVFRSRDQWQSLIQRQANSGQSVEKFCRDESLSATAFYRWRQIFNSDQTGSPDRLSDATKNTFIELTPPSLVNTQANTSTSSESMDWCVELQIGANVVLRVRA